MRCPLQVAFPLTLLGLWLTASGCSGGHDAADLDATRFTGTGVWDITSNGSAGEQEVLVVYADESKKTTRVTADVAQTISLELLPLPVSGRVKVGLISEADPAANTIALRFVDQRGEPFGNPVTLRAEKGSFVGELIIAKDGAVPGASAAFFLGLSASSSCRIGKQSGLKIKMPEDGSSAEMTQFSRLLLDRGVNDACSDLLQGEVDANSGAAATDLSPLGHAMQSGAVSADKVAQLARIEVDAAVTTTRISRDTPLEADDVPGGFAPQDDERSLPIKLVLPALVAAGSPVVIEGYLNASARPDDLDIALQVKDPGGRTTTFAAKANAMGQFFASFEETSELGTYQVTATQGANAIETQAEFEVVAIGSVTAAIREELSGGITIAQGVIAHLEGILNPLPPAAEKDTLTDKIAAAKQDLVEGQAQVDDVVLSLDAILIVAEEQPSLAEHLAPELQKLSSWAADGQKLREHWQSMLDRAKMQPTLCDTIEYAGEASRALSTALNFTGRGVGMLINVATDKLLPQAIAQLPFSGPNAAQQKLVVTEGAKSFAAVAQGFSSWVNSFVGIAVDLATYATEELMKAYCVRFEGPIFVDYTETWLAGFDEWARMIQKISGKIIVRYPKGAAAGSSITVTGHIEGNATKFDFWEHYEHVDDPSAYNLIELVRFSLVPLSARIDLANNDPGFGMFARMAMPAYFNIPIQGEIKGDKLAFKLLPATQDYSSIVKYTLVVVLFEPITFIPQLFIFDFPTRNAATVLTGVMGEPFEASLAVDQSEGTTRFERALSTQRDLSGGVSQKWNLLVQGRSMN